MAGFFGRYEEKEMLKHIRVCDVCEKEIPDKLGDYSWKRLHFYEEHYLNTEDGYVFPDFCHKHALAFLQYCQKTIKNDQMCKLYKEFQKEYRVKK